MGIVEKLSACDFKYGGRWPLEAETSDQFIRQFPAEPGVYIFVVNDEVRYVGKTQKQGLRKRLRKYTNLNNPGLTAVRVRGHIAEALQAGNEVKVYFMTPEVAAVPWKGFSLDLIAGLEEGLIQELQPRWNRHGIRDPEDEDEQS